MIRLHDVSFVFDNKINKTADKKIGIKPLAFDLHIESGERVAIIGASGAGKSTLMNLIAGFMLPTTGSIFLHGTDHTLSKPHERPVSMLFQANNLFNHLTVEQNIGLAIKPNLKLNSEEWIKVAEMAKKVGIFDMLKRKPTQLSGGQQQRVAIARCLLRNTPILLLDEPFSALDKPLRIEMLKLLEDLCNSTKLTLLLVTHQPEELADFVDRQIEIAC